MGVENVESSAQGASRGGWGPRDEEPALRRVSHHIPAVRVNSAPGGGFADSLLLHHGCAMSPGRAPTLQLRAPASVSSGTGKGSLGQGSREGAEALSPPMPLLGLQGFGVSLGGWKEAELLVQLPDVGWAERGVGRWLCAAQLGMTAWHSMAWHGTTCSLGCPWSIGTIHESLRFHGTSRTGADSARLDAPSPGPTLRQRGTGLRNELTEQNQAA